MADDLECAVCMEVYLVPRFLPCGHCYCEECIKELIKGNAVVCPQCRVEHTVSQNGVKGFPVVYTVQQMIERRCPHCRRGQPEADCLHCNKRLCLDCVTKHTSVDLLQNKKSQLERLIQESDDQTSLLGETQLMDDIDELGVKLHSLVDQRIQKLKTEGKSLILSLKTSNTELVTEPVTQARKLIKSMPSVDLDAELDVIEKSIATCEDLITKITKLSSQTSGGDTVQLTADTSQVVSAVSGVGSLSVTGQFSDPHDVTCNRGTGHLLVTDGDNYRLQELDATSHAHIRDIPTSVDGKQVAPWFVHCTGRGEVVVCGYVTYTDSCVVLLYDAQGRYRKSLQGPWRYPRGITSDSSSIYVCDWRAGNIRVFTLDGDYSRDITNPSIKKPGHITTLGDQLVVSEDRTIHYLTKDGRLVRSLQDVVGSDIRFLTSHNGLVYVSSSRDPLSVVEDGKVIQTADQCRDGWNDHTPWKLYGPLGLTVTQDNKLAVANYGNHNLLVYNLE